MLFSLHNKPSISKATRLFSLTIKDERLLLWRLSWIWWKRLVRRNLTARVCLRCQLCEYFLISSEEGSYRLPHRLLEQHTLLSSLSFLLSPLEWLETFPGWWKSMQKESKMQTSQHRRSCKTKWCSSLFGLPSVLWKSTQNQRKKD